MKNEEAMRVRERGPNFRGRRRRRRFISSRAGDGGRRLVWGGKSVKWYSSAGPIWLPSSVVEKLAADSEMIVVAAMRSWRS